MVRPLSGCPFLLIGVPQYHGHSDPSSAPGSAVATEHGFGNYVPFCAASQSYPLAAPTGIR